MQAIILFRFLAALSSAGVFNIIKMNGANGTRELMSGLPQIHVGIADAREVTRIASRQHHDEWISPNDKEGTVQQQLRLYGHSLSFRSHCRLRKGTWVLTESVIDRRMRSFGDRWFCVSSWIQWKPPWFHIH